MKKNLLFVLLLLSANLFSQVDTLLYPHAKASNLLGVTMNVPSEFAGYSQYYDAPETVIVKGIKFYAGINSTNPADSALITCYLFSADTDSSVMDTLDQKDIMIYPSTFSTVNLSLMTQVVMFDNIDTVTSAFHVGIRSNTNTDLGIITNDYNAGDGGNEALGYWYWTGDDTWYKSGEFFTWDVDFLIHPIVEYLPLANGVTSGCDSICINHIQSPAASHRMYNSVVFSGGSTIDSTQFDWGDGSNSSYNDTCHFYAQGAHIQQL